MLGITPLHQHCSGATGIQLCNTQIPCADCQDLPCHLPQSLCLGKEHHTHRQSCPTEQLEMVRNRPSCRENSKKWSSVMSAFPKGDSRVFKTYWCENSARYRYAKRELAHFMGLEKNWVSQLFGCFSSCFCCTGLVLFLPMLLSAD